MHIPTIKSFDLNIAVASLDRPDADCQLVRVDRSLYVIRKATAAEIATARLSDLDRPATLGEIASLVAQSVTDALNARQGLDTTHAPRAWNDREVR
jgi:hypothetical protein